MIKRLWYWIYSIKRLCIKWFNSIFKTKQHKPRGIDYLYSIESMLSSGIRLDYQGIKKLYSSQDIKQINILFSTNRYRIDGDNLILGTYTLTKPLRSNGLKEGTLDNGWIEGVIKDGCIGYTCNKEKLEAIKQYLGDKEYSVTGFDGAIRFTLCYESLIQNKKIPFDWDIYEDVKPMIIGDCSIRIK